MNLAKNKKAFHTVTLFLINLKVLIFFQGNVLFKNGAKSLHLDDINIVLYLGGSLRKRFPFSFAETTGLLEVFRFLDT